MSITIDLSNFGQRELKMLEQLLTGLREQGVPKNFNQSGLKPCLNENSGFVFLTNEDYDVLMMNGNTLEEWLTCHYCGHEGFFEDFAHEAQDDCCNECMLAAGVEPVEIASMNP